MLDSTQYRSSMTSLFLNSRYSLWAPSMSQYYVKLMSIVSNSYYHADRWENRSSKKLNKCSEPSQCEHGKAEIRTQVSLSHQKFILPPCHLPLKEILAQHVPMNLKEDQDSTLSISEQERLRTNYEYVTSILGRTLQMWMTETKPSDNVGSTGYTRGQIPHLSTAKLHSWETGPLCCLWSTKIMKQRYLPTWQGKATSGASAWGWWAMRMLLCACKEEREDEKE